MILLLKTQKLKVLVLNFQSDDDSISYIQTLLPDHLSLHASKRPQFAMKIGPSYWKSNETVLDDNTDLIKGN